MPRSPWVSQRRGRGFSWERPRRWVRWPWSAPASVPTAWVRTGGSACSSCSWREPAASCLLLAGGQLLGLPVAMVGVLGGIILQFASIGTMHAAVVDRAGPAVARATAATMTGYYLGALVSPVAFGAFVDGVGSYEWAWLILGILLGASALAFRQAGRIAPVE